MITTVTRIATLLAIPEDFIEELCASRIVVLEDSGLESSGVERSDVERSDVERSDVEHSDFEHSVVEHSDFERTVERVRVSWTLYQELGVNLAGIEVALHLLSIIERDRRHLAGR